MMRILLVIILLLPAMAAFSQPAGDSGNDSTILLNAITIRAYQHERRLLDVPASVGVIGERVFERGNNSSLLPAINTLPGVRMEERSPGSYRLSIRGSTLRSPFGLRNVKVYWNDLPLTDPGGNTYLNLLDFGSIQNAEVIKGPGGSLYGAGTGGVVLMRSEVPRDEGASAGFSATAGSYGSLRYTAEVQRITNGSEVALRYAHLQSDGYRRQTQMSRDVVHALGKFRVSDERKIEVNLFYADLFYETPGGLTENEFREDPGQARPPAGPNPGAEEQRAAVYNKTFYGGFAHQYRWNSRWSNSTGVYGTHSQFDNPAIRNYEKRVEMSFGGRSNTQFAFNGGKLDFGIEFQHGFSPISVYDNNRGQSGSLQNNDEIISTSALAFTQLEFYLPYDFFLTAGGSMNFVDVRYQRLSDLPPFHQRKKFDPVFSPRVAVLKRITENTSVHASVSRGFSPPTVAELYPSTATFNDAINPEEGTNFEIGFRGSLYKNALQFDVVAYSFRLTETIVVRRTSDDADYFVNAGKTDQKGLEVSLSWNAAQNRDSPFLSLAPWLSYSLNHYRFSDYTQDVNDYSGNKLTGVSPNILSAGVDLMVKNGLYANITFTYTDRIPLNDANSEFADPYSLLGIKAGYRFVLEGDFPINLFAGVDNVLDEKYSLGHDLNAFGGRFYNPAMPVSFYVGIKGKIGLINR
ncbi:MAG TPA: TonB-dependent receptor [Cyclobacteriaceae bacterium]